MSFKKQFEHQQDLFRAALEEFSVAGYDQASINAILEKAGMSKGQFYYHFENKQGLYFALIEVLISRKQSFLAEVMRPEDLQQDFFSILKTQIRYGARFARNHADIHAFSESFLREKGNAIYDQVLEAFNLENNTGLNLLIERAFNEGEFREELPLSFVRKTVGYLFTHASDLTDLTSPDHAEENLDRLIEFMRAGLGRNFPNFKDQK